MSLDRREKPLVTSAKDELFENIFIRYYPLVYRLAYRYVGQPDEAEDIAQEVFLRFYHLHLVQRMKHNNAPGSVVSQLILA